MGGFVAADTLFSILDNRPISPDPNVKLMFPLIQGVLTFDTPYNGLSRSMFAYGAFSQYQNISSIWNLYSSVTSFGAGATTSQIVSSRGSSWARWQALAARTGTYGAIIAGGAAAYANRAEIAEYLSKINKDNISQSWSKVNKESLSEGLLYVSRDSVGEGFAWMSGHLKFVGALMKQAQLQTRLERLSQLKGIGLVNLYTSLGENGYWTGGYFVPKRTFCAVPTGSKDMGKFKEQANTKAANEIQAHCGMFKPERNPQYGTMVESARDLILGWLENDPRKVVDDYTPDQLQRSRSSSESQLFDDDGKVKSSAVNSAHGKPEDELQLDAILRCQGMPQPEDGGVSDADLKRASEVPLPVDAPSWRSRVPNPRISNPLGSISLPAIRIPGWGGQKKEVVAHDTLTATGDGPASPDELHKANLVTQEES